MRSLSIAGAVGAATLAMLATPTPADGDVRVRIGFGSGHHHHHYRHHHHHHRRHHHHHGHFHRRQYRPVRHHHHYYTRPRTTYYYYNTTCPPRYTSYSYTSSSYYPSSNYYQSTNYYPSSNVNVNLGSTYTAPPPVTTTTPQYTYPQNPTYATPPQPAVPATTSGWSLLSSGRTQDALKSFAAESTTYPNDPVAKAGYAIAAALEQDDELAIWTMRRALRLDARALTGVPVDEGLGYQLTALIERYEATLRTQPRRPDLHVMIAALSLVNGDMERAAFSTNAAAELGDDDYSVQNLRSAVNLIATSNADL